MAKYCPRYSFLLILLIIFNVFEGHCQVIVSNETINENIPVTSALVINKLINIYPLSFALTLLCTFIYLRTR